MNKTKKNKIPKKKGRKPKYNNDEERKAAQRERSKKYYEKNRELCMQKQNDKYKEKAEIIKQYKEGKLVTIL
jgi:hypothetical protein